MRKIARWIAIVASLYLACAVHAATVKKPRAHHSSERSAHATYRTARYARQSSSTASHPVHRTATTKRHYTHRRYSRRRYHHHVVLPKAPSPERITQIQTALARGGYYKGDPTGKWGPDTVAAVQKFQSANNIDDTGKLDAPTLQKLGLGSDIAGVAAPRQVVPKGCCSAAPAPATVAPSKPAGSASPAPAVDHSQPVSTASGNPQSSVGSAAASTPAAATPAAASSDTGAADPSSASKPAAAQH